MTQFGENASAAVQFVQEGHNKFLGKAESTLAEAIAQITALSHFNTTPTAFNVSFDYNDHLAPFQRPVSPVLDSAGFALRPLDLPGLPPAFDLHTVDVGTTPEYDLVAPVIAFAAKPERPVIARPTAPARPAAPVMPDEPDYQRYIPEKITLRDLNLPTFADLQLPEYAVSRRGLGNFAIGDVGSFTPEAYVSALLDKVKSRVTTWMDGQEALPVAIERALFARGRSRVTVETEALVEQAVDDFGARGFTQPPGMLAARIDAIRQAGQDRIADFSREAMLKSFDEALANMRLAVSSGLQLEGMAINLHLEHQRLLLASAGHLRDTSVAVLNARIAWFNAEIAAAEDERQQVETVLKIELAQLEDIRQRLEGEKLKGDINEQTVRQYEAQWGAVEKLANFHRSRVEAVKVIADTNRIPIEIFEAETRAFETLWSAHAKEWDGYRASVEGETSKATLHRSLVEAFTARTNGVVQFGRLKLDQEQLRVTEHGQQLQHYEAGLRRVGLQLDAERARLAAVGQKADAEATLYRARADVEQAASAATDRSFQLGLEAARARVDTQMEQARIRSNENVALQGLTLEALKAIATILSQLAASTMSAVNYGASVSSADNYGHDRSVAWTGEAEDWQQAFV